MKKYIFKLPLLLFSLFLILCSPSPVLASLNCSGNTCTDNFDSGFSDWATNGSVQQESTIVGNSRDSVKLSNTTSSGSVNGLLFKTFTDLIPGAEYHVSVKAGVFADGAGESGQVTLVAGNEQMVCTEQTCPASGSSIGNTTLRIGIIPTSTTLTVYLSGTQGGCNDQRSCHDPYVDDFSLTKTADAPPAVTSTSNAANCSDLSINNGDAITAGGTYSATVIMNNPSNTSTQTFNPWTSGGNYKLGAQQPQANSDTPIAWGDRNGGNSGKGSRPARVNLASSPIDPGNPTTFTFNTTAPDTSGTYRFSYQMVKDGTGGEWFGAICQPDIFVSSATSQNPNLEVTCSVNPTSTTTNQNVSWTADTLGGTGPFTYVWAGTNALAGKTTTGSALRTNSQTISYSSKGTKTGSVTVTDSSSPAVTTTASCPDVTISDPFNYSLSNTGNLTLTQGSSGSTIINVSQSAGNPQTVNLSSSSTLPDGASKDLLPASCSPNLTCYSAYTVYANAGTPVGTYPITVNGASTGVSSKSTTFNLIVTAPAAGGGSLPTVNLQANNSEGPLTLNNNTAVALSWVTTNNPDSCSASGNWSGSKASSSGGTAHIESITPNLTGPNVYTYTIVCQKGSDTASDTVVVVVLGPDGTPPGGGGTTPPASRPNLPWIQTTGGDVHSNTKITTPGGPQ